MFVLRELERRCFQVWPKPMIWYIQQRAQTTQYQLRNAVQCVSPRLVNPPYDRAAPELLPLTSRMLLNCFL